MNKRSLIEKIIAQLSVEVESYARSARAAQAEATDEQSKAENKYDTRGLEASYLAHGQSRQAAEMEESIEQFRGMTPREFGAKDAIDLSALVEIEGRDGPAHYFIGPCAGGTQIVHGGKTIVVITPQSPLGQQLTGARAGDCVKIENGRVRNEYRVIAVS